MADRKEAQRTLALALLSCVASYQRAWALLREHVEVRDILKAQDYPAYNYFATSGHEASKAAARLAEALQKEQH